MKLLIDTNVFIPLEPASTSDLESLSPDAARLLQVIQKERHEVFLHPKSRVDITRDKNESRRRLRMLAFNKYPHLASVEPFPLFSEKLPLASPDSKKHEIEASAALSNLQTYFEVLKETNNVQTANQQPFIHPEPEGMVAIDPRGAKIEKKPGKLKAVRLYVYATVINQTLYLLGIGDKDS